MEIRGIYTLSVYNSGGHVEHVEGSCDETIKKIIEIYCDLLWNWGTIGKQLFVFTLIFHKLSLVRLSSVALG